MAQRDISPNDDLGKLAREAQQLAAEKEKQGWKFNHFWFDKKRKLWFGPNNNPVLQRTLKFPLPTTVHALNYWCTDKMIAFINQYEWGNIKKATKSDYRTCPTCPKYNPGKPVCTAPGHFKLLNSGLPWWSSGKESAFQRRGHRFDPWSGN